MLKPSQAMRQFLQHVKGSPTRRRCSICGMIDSSRPGSHVVIGTHKAATKHVGRCQRCGILICGACAMPEFDVYFGPFTRREDGERISVMAVIQWIGGRKIRELMNEVYEKHRAELVLTYKCRKCRGEVDF